MSSEDQLAAAAKRFHEVERRVEAELAQAREERDEAIRQARAEGLTIRAIAEIVGLHPSRVGRLVD